VKFAIYTALLKYSSPILIYYSIKSTSVPKLAVKNLNFGLPVKNPKNSLIQL